MKIEIYTFKKSKLITPPQTVKVSEALAGGLYHKYEKHYDDYGNGIEFSKLTQMDSRKQSVKCLSKLERICEGKVIRAMIQKPDILEIYIREK